MSLEILGIDIGGANLKSSHTNRTALTRSFPVWKHLSHLANELRQLVRESPHHDCLAVTMTAELCDCFESKKAGVHAILDAVEAAVDSKPIWVWLNTREFVSCDQARDAYLKVAAANWSALAEFAGRFIRTELGILLDIGSTTTDIVPIGPTGSPLLPATDLDRLVAHHLVYTGVRRTPLCAVLHTVQWRDQVFCPAAELFATTQDAYLLLGEIPENGADGDTADGRPATKKYAHARIARMLCADADLLSYDDAVGIAEQAREAQIAQLCEALNKAIRPLSSPVHTVVLAGSGEFLARKAIDSSEVRAQRVVSLAQELGCQLSQAACAYAVAVLAAERS